MEACGVKSGRAVITTPYTFVSTAASAVHLNGDVYFADIEENKESFGRYYPLFRVRIESDGLMDMSIALLINDDLYAYSKELAEQEEE